MRLFDSVVATLGLSQPFQRFVREVLMLLLVVPGRATFLNLSRYSRYDEKTFRRGFRREVHWAALNVAAIRAVVPAHHEQVLAFDPSFIPKSGKHTPGLGRFWNSCTGRAELGLEIHVLAWVDVTANTAYAIQAALTPPEPTPAAPRTTGTTQVEDSRVDAYLAHVCRVIPEQGLSTLRYLTADGYFGKVKFVDGIQALGMDVISKLRRDADLLYLYTGPYRGRGRPRRYDGKVDLVRRERFTTVPFPETDRLLETAVVYAPRLRRCLRVVVVTHRHTQGRAVLFSTDTDLDPVKLYRYYVARFQIEFLFRDSKQFTGLAHSQARHAQALTFHVNASLTAVSLTKPQAMQTHAHAPIPFSMANAVRRAFNEHFLQRLLAHLAHGGRLAENSPEYETFCNYGLIQPIAA
ncbi:MAG: transposase [Nitrospira sp.]|nr:transposase [Nitrospira sp.]